MPYDDPIEGWELTPQECIELSHGGVLRERIVQAGETFLYLIRYTTITDLMPCVQVQVLFVS